MLEKLTFNLINNYPPKPDISPDIGVCSDCGGRFKLSDCEKEFGHHDGYESIPYTEVLCPECEGGGCIDDFDMSTDRLEDYIKYTKVK